MSPFQIGLCLGFALGVLYMLGNHWIMYLVRKK